MRVRVVCALVFLASSGLLSCSKSAAPTPDTDSFDRNAFLVSEGENVILPAYRSLLSEAQKLEAATAGTSLEASREAWKGTSRALQFTETFQLGPSGSAASALGGKDLRDQLYSWPTVSPCKVDQALVSRDYARADFFETALVNSFGLAAIEYLLFYEGAANACPASSTINVDGSWNQLTAEDRASRRAEYARLAAQHVTRSAQALVQAWDPAGDDFISELGRSGESGATYSSPQAAVNELFAAMFYIDLKTKDLKLAAPVGLSENCATDTCPELLESRWSGTSGDNVVQNLRGLRAIFVGNAEGEAARPGFDDFLADRGANEFAQSMTADIDAAIAASQFPGGLEAAITADPTRVRAAHAAIKKVSDQMKTQMVTVLNLTVPKEGASDND